MKKVVKSVSDFENGEQITHYEQEISGTDRITFIEQKCDRILEMLAQKPCEKTPQKLYEALAKAQAEMGDMTFTGVNTYYHDKYATLSDLVSMTRPALTKYGLSVYQFMYQDEHDVNYMKTVLAHASGEKIESIMRISPNKNTVQQIGSYLAHVRRLCYAAIVGCMVHDIDDDDGVSCMEEYNRLAEQGVAPAFTSKDSYAKEFERISRDELAELEKSMGMHHDLGQQIMEAYHLAGLADLPKSKYTFVLGQLRKNVARREGNLL